MGDPSSQLPRLSSDRRLSFEDAEHFSREVETNLTQGRAMIRSDAPLKLYESFGMQLVVPGLDDRVQVGARVVFEQDGLLGLQITDLDENRRMLLRSIASRALAPPTPEAATPEPEPQVPFPEPEPQPEAEPKPQPEAEPPSPEVIRTDASPPEEDAPEGPRHPFLLAPQGPTWSPQNASSLLAFYLLALEADVIPVHGEALEEDTESLAVHFGSKRCVLKIEALATDALRVPDPSPLVEVLGAHAHDLQRVLRALGLGGGTRDLPADVEGAAQPASAQDDPGPPRPPTLDGDIVSFDRPVDLRAELDTNVRNGGLFVFSSPLPLQQQRTLRFTVSGHDLGLSIVADVVFADAGRVGFSFREKTYALATLEQAASSPLPKAGSATGTIDLRAAPMTSEVPAFGGTLAKALPINRMLDLQSVACKDPSQLAHTPVVLLFEFINRKGWTGTLELNGTENQRRVIYFHQGDVAFVEAHPFEESTSLGRILVGMRKLNEASLREALERTKGSAKLLGKMLVLLGTIRRGDLLAALREQTRQKMDAAFEWSSGAFQWGPWRDPPGDADLVVTRGSSIIARYFRTRLEQISAQDLESMFGATTTEVVVHDDLDAASSGLQLQPRELRFLELQVDGKRTVHEAVTGSPIGRLASLRLIAICLALGYVRFADAKVSMDLTNAPAAKKRAAGSDPKVELQAELARLSKANHFDALGVHWSSHPRHYRETWSEVRSQFDPKSPKYADAGPEVQALARDVQRKLDHAYDSVKDAASRTAYRKELFDKTERQYAAEMLMKQAEVSTLRGDHVSAVEALETAVELAASPKARAMLDALRRGG